MSVNYPSLSLHKIFPVLWFQKLYDIKGPFSLVEREVNLVPILWPDLNQLPSITLAFWLVKLGDKVYDTSYSAFRN